MRSMVEGADRAAASAPSTASRSCRWIGSADPSSTPCGGGMR